MSEPRLDGRTVKGSVGLSNNEHLHFHGQHLRHERTGVHGYLEILHDDTLLTYDQFNFDRHADRLRIANAAHKLLDDNPMTDSGKPYTSMLLKHDVDLFCRQAWEVWNGQFEGVELEGDVISEPTVFLAAPHIIQGGGTVLVGKPGKGKSYTALTIAVAVDSGTNGFWGVTQAKTMFVNLERSAASISKRIGAVNDVLGLEPGRKLVTLNARGRSLSDVEGGIERTIKHYGIEFVVLDSISRAGMGDLIENRTANAIADSLNGLGTAWLAIAHSPRSSDNIFGSQMFDAAADIIVQHKGHQAEEEVGVQLTMTKANDSALAPPMYLGLKFDEYGLKQVRLAKGKDFPELRAEEEVSAAQQIYDYLIHEVSSDYPSHIAEELNIKRTTVNDILKDTTKYTKRREGNRSFYAVRSDREEGS